MELVHQLLELPGAHLERHHCRHLRKALDTRLAHAPDLVAREHLEDGEQPSNCQLGPHHRRHCAHAQRRRLAHPEGGVVGEAHELGQHVLAAQVVAEHGGEGAEQLRGDHAVLLDLVVVRQAQHLAQHRVAHVSCVDERR